MHVDSVNFNSINNPQTKQHKNVADAEEIRCILFLGIKSDLPSPDTKRKVDIII